MAWTRVRNLAAEVGPRKYEGRVRHNFQRTDNIMSKCYLDDSCRTRQDLHVLKESDKQACIRWNMTMKVVWGGLTVGQYT